MRHPGVCKCRLGESANAGSPACHRLFFVEKFGWQKKHVIYQLFWIGNLRRVHTGCFSRAAISSRVNRISSLISSSVSSGLSLAATIFLNSRNSLRAWSSASGEFALIMKGILCVRTTALANTFIAVLALMPIREQNASNFCFSCESILTVIDTCAIVFAISIISRCKYNLFISSCHHFGAKKYTL